MLRAYRRIDVWRREATAAGSAASNSDAASEVARLLLRCQFADRSLSARFPLAKSAAKRAGSIRGMGTDDENEQTKANRAKSIALE